jgi:hypothetical protein
VSGVNACTWKTWWPLLCCLCCVGPLWRDQVDGWEKNDVAKVTGEIDRLLGVRGPGGETQRLGRKCGGT